jgi:uncharacterized protein (DUF58 family)
VIVFAILAVALAVPLLIVVIALGPVILGILCAVGFGLIVFVGANFVLGLGLFGRSVERSAVRHWRHARYGDPQT